MPGATVNQYHEAGDGIAISPEGKFSTASPTPANTFVVQLSTDESIAAAVPTLPDTFPAGQPAVLLSLTETFRAGRTLVTGIFSMSLENNDPANEYEPRLVFFVYLDGAPLPLAHATLDMYSPALPANLVALNAPGAIRTVIDDLEAGEHTFELRWGVQGKVPACTAYCWPSEFDCATLQVQEI